MAEREAANALKVLAQRNQCAFLEGNAENVWNERLFANGIHIGWRDGRVAFLAVWNCPFEPPTELLGEFQCVEKVQVRPSPTQNLHWLGAVSGIRNLALYHWDGSDGEAMPEHWACESTLEQLYLDSVSGKIPDSFRRFHKLRKMGFDSEGLLILPDWLAELENLQKIFLRNCHIQSMPAAAVKTGLPFRMEGNAERGIFLEGATLEEGDINLFSQSREMIELQYQKDVMRQVRECKVIFLGDGGVGKTSLIKRIIDDRFQEGEKSTDGVQMRNWTTAHEGIPFTLRFLDFGGQEIMYAMHRCFLTRHTVYVVVCEGRTDSNIDSVAARWLETVRSFAPDCPVILALNKADLNPDIDVNRRDLKTRNPFLRRVLHTSAKLERNDEYGAERLLREILKAVRECVDFSEANESWLGIKSELEDLEEEKVPYIDAARYQEICAKHGVVSPAIQFGMLQHFNDLGVVYFYSSDAFNPTLENIRVLNPAWLTNGIYWLILRTPDTGFLPHKIIRETLEKSCEGDISNATYNETEMSFILQVMRKFGISIPIGDGMEMIPMRMRKTPSEAADKFPRTSALHLRWEVKYPPNNLIHRLVIRKESELARNPEESEPDRQLGEAVWLTGGLFRQETTGCVALAEMNDEGLDVYVTGQTQERRQYMESFRSVILKLLEELNLQVEEVIVHRIKGKEGRIPYLDVMEQYRQAPTQKIFLSGAQEYVSPLELLQETYLNYESEVQSYQNQHSLQQEIARTEMENKRAETRKLNAETRLARIQTATSIISAFPVAIAVILLVMFLTGLLDMETLLKFLDLIK